MVINKNLFRYCIIIYFIVFWFNVNNIGLVLLCMRVLICFCVFLYWLWRCGFKNVFDWLFFLKCVISVCINSVCGLVSVVWWLVYGL